MRAETAVPHTASRTEDTFAVRGPAFARRSARLPPGPSASYGSVKNHAADTAKQAHRSAARPRVFRRERPRESISMGAQDFSHNAQTRSAPPSADDIHF